MSYFGSAWSSSAMCRRRARTSRVSLLTAGTVLVLAASAPGASAATLSVSVEDAQVGQDAAITFTGSADEPSTIENYQQLDGPACPATPQQFMQEVAAGTRKTPGSRPGNATVTAAGSFNKQQVASSDVAGRQQLCSYLLANSDSRVTAAGGATFTFTAGPPPNTGCFALAFNPRAALDLLNSIAMQFTGRGECANDDAVTLKGTGKVTVRPSDRKKYKLPSTTILKGQMGPCGEGVRCIFFKLAPAVKRKLRAAEVKQGRPLKLRMTLKFVMTAPFKRTYRKELRTVSTRTHFFCESSNADNAPCAGSATGQSRGEG